MGLDDDIRTAKIVVRSILVALFRMLSIYIAADYENVLIGLVSLCLLETMCIDRKSGGWIRWWSWRLIRDRARVESDCRRCWRYAKAIDATHVTLFIVSDYHLRSIVPSFFYLLVWRLFSFLSSFFFSLLRRSREHTWSAFYPLASMEENWKKITAQQKKYGQIPEKPYRFTD